MAEATRYEAWLVPSFAEGCEQLRALAQDEAAPDVARLSDTAETHLTFALGGIPGVLRERRGDRCLLVAGWEGEARRRSRRGARRRCAGSAACGWGAASARAGRRTASTARTCATT